MARAVISPTSRPPIRPGPAVTATASSPSQSAPASLHRGADHPVQRLDMRARGDLRHDAAEGRVIVGLAEHDVGEDRAAPVGVRAARPPRRSRRSSSRCRAPSRRVRFQASLQFGRPETRARPETEPPGSYHPGPEWRKRSASARAAAGWRSGRPARCAMRSRPRTAFAPRRSRSSPIRTSGDRIQDRALAQGGRQGAFHQGDRGGAALRQHRYRRAFGEGHGDVPAGRASRSAPASSARIARDVLIARSGGDLASLPQGARIGTASLRREALIRRARPDVTIGAAARQRADAAGARRGGRFRRHAARRGRAAAPRAGKPRRRRYLPLDAFPPACGQGAVAVECRAADDADRARCSRRSTIAETGLAVACERAFLAALGGSCRTPVAGLCAGRRRPAALRRHRAVAGWARGL